MTALHDLGYLPIAIKALPEGSICGLKVPCLTIVNTLPEFFWLPNYMETLLSVELWKPMTSATTALQYRRMFDKYAELTGYDKDFVQWQGHDFSMRGMSGTEDAMISAAGHLLSFTGTDCVCALDFIEMFYNADATTELIGGSVPATEHSVMCMGGQADEIGTFRRLITELYPAGVVSIVSDTWDFWQVVTEYVPALKAEILARNGRVVLRPDSGNPVHIICGDPEAEDAHVRKGAYECLWETFGGHVNAKGYKMLDTHIGLIYGDSITLERQRLILEQLEAKGFAFSNGVLGIGSYTYEYVTRDTFGFAMKATYGVVNGEGRNIFKDPKTDSGFKKSAKGMLCVLEDGSLKDECTAEEEACGMLREVFRDGVLLVDEKFSDIRARLRGNA